MGNVAYGPLPEGPGARERECIKVRRCQGANQTHFLLLGGRMVGVYTHWDPTIGQTVGCGGEDGCPHCLFPGRRWYGFLPAVLPATREVCLVEVTEACARSMLAHPAFDKGFRGHRLTLFRKDKKSKKAPLYWKAEMCAAARQLPEPFDPTPHLERLYRTWNRKATLLRSAMNTYPERLDGEPLPDLAPLEMPTSASVLQLGSEGAAAGESPPEAGHLEGPVPHAEPVYDVPVVRPDVQQEARSGKAFVQGLRGSLPRSHQG